MVRLNWALRRQRLFRQLTKLRQWLVQWGWWAWGVPAESVGYGSGYLTWRRGRRHRARRRRVHICLLRETRPPRDFVDFLAFWINERCVMCSASVERDAEAADVFWVCAADPVSGADLDRMRRVIAARPHAAVINPPDRYNVYHEAGTFHRLAAAGVSVPRVNFTDADRGRTPVVYKRRGMQGAEKFVAAYRGPIEDHRCCAYVDVADADGLHRRYRALHVVDFVHPVNIITARSWDVARATMTRIDYGFDLTDFEAEQTRLIGRTLGLQYFAVDFVRQPADGRPFFTDINVYPRVTAAITRAERPDLFGQFHACDARRLLRLSSDHEPDFWPQLDAAMVRLVDSAARADSAGPAAPLR